MCEEAAEDVGGASGGNPLCGTEERREVCSGTRWRASHSAAAPLLNSCRTWQRKLKCLKLQCLTSKQRWSVWQILVEFLFGHIVIVTWLWATKDFALFLIGAQPWHVDCSCGFTLAAHWHMKPSLQEWRHLHSFPAVLSKRRAVKLISCNGGKTTPKKIFHNGQFKLNFYLCMIAGKFQTIHL